MVLLYLPLHSCQTGTTAPLRNYRIIIVRTLRLGQLSRPPISAPRLLGLSTSSANAPVNSDVPFILDTAHVATKIREILSTNNIGQRLFAKHVLGLSQGTVSELLSKPKHWEKLTEKGRESYRKMHLWAYDEDNVNSLKAFAPKKGKWGYMN